MCKLLEITSEGIFMGSLIGIVAAFAYGFSVVLAIHKRSWIITGVVIIGLVLCWMFYDLWASSESLISVVAAIGAIAGIVYVAMPLQSNDKTEQR
jgi:hypothetical protein